MEAPRILILGGTNFMGKALVDQLQQCHPHAQVYLVNRGKTYWNNEVYTQHPGLKYFYGDRSEHTEMHKAIQYLGEKIGISPLQPWTAVVDFTSYKWRDVQSIAKALKGKTQLYIFISTDSIYNNSVFGQGHEMYSGGITESGFDIESEYRKLKNVRVSDRYGYNKLKCELYLKRRPHLPYICLRLPDVLGPYDNTNRYWCLLEWLKQSHKHPMELCRDDTARPLSFVYSKDVARQILDLISRHDSLPKHKSYNLCCTQAPTYEQLIAQIGLTMTPPRTPSFTPTGKKTSNGMYPSTSYTRISCELAQRELAWRPSTLEECLRASTEFFEGSGAKYENEHREMMREYRKKVAGRD